MLFPKVAKTMITMMVTGLAMLTILIMAVMEIRPPVREPYISGEPNLHAP